MAIADKTGVDYGTGGVSIKASGAITADNTATAVFVGRGWFFVVYDVTAIDIASGDELYNIQLQANTAAAASTWIDLAPALCIGHTSVVGGAASGVVGKYVVGVFNPYDNQVRLQTWTNGTTPSITFAADAYPLHVAAAY